MNNIMSSFTAEMEANLTDEVKDQVKEVALSISKPAVTATIEEDAHDVNIEDLFSDDGVDVQDVYVPNIESPALLDSTEFSGNSALRTSKENIETEMETLATQSKDGSTQSGKMLSEAEVKSMLQSIQNDKKTKKKWNIGIKDFNEKFKDAASIDKNFLKTELDVCIGPIVGKLKSLGLMIRRSMSKAELVTLMSKVLGDGSILERKRKIQKTPDSLKLLCKKIVNNLPKLALNVVYAEHIYANKLQEWYLSSPFGQNINIQNQTNFHNKTWYSKPEYNASLGYYLFLILDSYHQLCGARRLVCQNGIPLAGIDKTAFHKIAKNANQNKCGLNIAMAIDLIDKQSVEFAKATFSPKVAKALLDVGAIKEAKFCNLVYNWYKAEDEPAVPVDVRIQYRLSLRDWLLEGVNFSHFPPYGAYVKGIPIVLYEGLLTNIERKIQLFPFVKRECYNVRAVGSMDIEIFFGTFQELDPRGTGVLAPQDIPTAISVAVELLDARLNPDRGFHMQTSKGKVYPVNEMDAFGQNLDPDGSDVAVIKDIDHPFNQSSRKRGKQKRKKGDVTQLNEPARGIQPVRQYHKRDETKILPHVRRGLFLEEFQST